ncbi:MAG: hypothetical protein PWP76_361 [Candidatus Diapherotrites archaeon]|nr:hypothetical protein [Candidatus Diapherotrites archaeon]MDN5367222.1 hypothetical protein [Candidatus Diapherotrites archaeon]
MNAKLVPLFLLFFMGVAWAVSPPEPGMQFYGYVVGAKDGTVITAVIGTSTETTVQNGAYGYASDLFIVTRPTGEYSVVHIYIGGTKYVDINFQSGALYELNIDARGMVFCGNGHCDGSETEELCPLDCPEPTPPPSGGGTLGGGGATPAPPEENVPPESGGTVTETSAHGTVTLFGTAPGTTVNVVESTDPPNTLECAPLDNVYAYLDVTVNGDYESGTVSFDVNASWYAENDLNLEATQILHCVNGTWEELNTELVSDVNGVYTFVSGPTTFSVIAIATEPNKQEAAETPQTGTTEGELNESVPPPVAPAPEEGTGNTGPTGLALLGSGALPIAIGTGMLVLVLLLLLWRR